MLDAAVRLVRTEGTAALTLARVAVDCGVTKPIAYQHFGSRDGLLMALYRQLGARHENAVREALVSNAAGALSREELAQTVIAAFVDCVLENGDHYSAISSALAAGTDTVDFRQEVRDSFLSGYESALASFVEDAPRKRRLFAIAFLGAAEHLSEAASRGAISRVEAITTLQAITLGRAAIA